MGTTLYYASLVEHEYFIGILNGRQAVGDGHGSTCLHQALKGILYQALTFGVESRGSLVEDEYGWILQYGTGYGDTLPLTTRETTASVTNVGVEALLGSHNEIVGIGYAGSLLYSFFWSS